jgi:hypothetical protein
MDQDTQLQTLEVLETAKVSPPVIHPLFDWGCGRDHASIYIEIYI